MDEGHVTAKHLLPSVQSPADLSIAELQAFDGRPGQQCMWINHSEKFNEYKIRT